MAKDYTQTRSARMDESLGMRRGKESMMKQSYKSRRDESYGMKRGMGAGKFDVPDNKHAYEVRGISTDSEKYDLGRVRYDDVGSKGYPAEAWNYKY